MFNIFQYLTDRLDRLPGIASVVRVRDRWKLDELLVDIRGMELPTVAVEVAGDGLINLQDGRYSRTSHTFHVLLQPEEPRVPDIAAIESKIVEAEALGMEILSMMLGESRDLDDPCYGFEASNIHFSKIATTGMQLCGCTFSIVMHQDHV